MRGRFSRVVRGAAAVVAAAAVSAGLAPAPGASGGQSDLDAFMATVLARRDENWKKLQQYILDERELIELRGPGRIPIWGERRDYTWFIQDGYFVRSPLKANGVEVGEADRRRYEAEYLRRMKEREKRAARAERERAGADPERVPMVEEPRDVDALLRQTRQPGFIDSAYFLRFKFEEGKYAFVGRETFDGRELLRIEYYPARLFSREQDQERQRQARGEQNRQEDIEAAMERLLNKVSLVTLWIEPAGRQIVKYTFDNVNLDFLPAAWLMRLTDLRATMTMSQPFPDVWLPRDLELNFGGMFAIGAFDLRLRLDYHDYREAKTSARIKLPEGR